MPKKKNPFFEGIMAGAKEALAISRGEAKPARVYARYIGILDGTEGSYGVTFPDLPGCTAMGDTKDEALRSAAGAVREWIESTIEHGEPIPVARSIEELQRDPEVQKELAEIGGVLVPVSS